jgi:hypothetical protein
MNEVIAHEMDLSWPFSWEILLSSLRGSIAETGMVVELLRVDEDRKE